MRAGRALLAAAVSALTVGALPAFAAPVVVLAPAPAEGGFLIDPQIAVDGAGTAHIVWRHYSSPIPDAIVYCRVPRGAGACAPVHRFVLEPGNSLYSGRVTLSRSGQVIVTANACCPFHVYAVVSADGGATFASPRVIAQGGNATTDEDVAIGPGDFALSFTGHVHYRAAPIDGSTATYATLASQPDQIPSFTQPAVGFPDPTSPLVAYVDLHGSGGTAFPPTGRQQLFFRRWGGSGDYNDGANWLPAIRVDDGVLPRLSSGPRGLFLFYVRKDDHRVRRWEGLGFGAPMVVPPPAPVGYGPSPYVDFVQDGSGTLHVVWDQSAVVRRVSRDGGKTWGRPESLDMQSLRQGDARQLQIGAAPDGSGGVVAVRGKTIIFKPLGPIGAGGGPGAEECIKTVTVGLTVTLAQEGCFRRKGDTYTSDGDVRVNGIDLRGGTSKAKVIIDRADRTLTTTGKVEARIGNVLLGTETIRWRLPTGEGEIRDLAGNPATFDTASSPPLLGFRVSGYTVPRILGKGRASVPVNIALPEPFDGLLPRVGASASTTLRANNAEGLEVRGIRFRVKDVSIGIADLGEFQLEFVAGTATLRGRGSILLPVIRSRLDTEFQLTNGAFDYGRASLTPPDPGIPVATDVFIRRIDFAVQKGTGCEKPTKIAGGVRVVTGPVVAGRALLDVDPATVSYSFPRATCGQDGLFEVLGKGKIIGIPAATLTAKYRTRGQFTFGAGVALDAEAASVKVGVEGGIDLPKKQFYASGTANATILDVPLASFDAIVSSVGMAGCGTGLPLPSPGSLIQGDPQPVQAGFEYRWGQSFDPDWPDTCDVDFAAYKPSAFQATPARATRGRAARRTTFTLPRGLPLVEVRLDGATAAPGVALTGPGGLQAVFPAGGSTRLQRAGIQIVSVPHLKRTYVRLARPPAGAYLVADVPGAPPIASAAVAQGLPEPSVRGTVRRSRRGTELSFRARPIKGQVLRFVEEGRDVRSVIATTRRSRGVVRFRPAPGAAGRRTVFAIVQQRGIPRAKIRIARYRAPSAGRPGRPRRVRVRRRGDRLVVTWRPAPRAVRYAVGFRLRDGRRGTRVTRARRLVLTRVPGINAGTIRVAGLRADNVAGPVAKVSLKPKPRKLPKKRRARRR